MPEQPATFASADVMDGAVELVRKWVAEDAATPADVASQRLAGVLRDPAGLAFAVGIIDGVLRPESVGAAASNLHRVAPLAPALLPWYLRGAVRVGGGLAPALPLPTVPLVRRALREMLGHLIVDARPDKLGAALQRLRQPDAGATPPRLNLTLLDDAVLGEAGAQQVLDDTQDLIAREDVEEVSLRVSGPRPSAPWAFEEAVEETVQRLLPLYLSAAAAHTTITLDVQEYLDLDLTIAVFARLMEDPRLRKQEAGIVLPAYLPDALPALRELTAWARDRVEHGGARIKVRLVKGANLAQEKADAVQHGWTPATYGSKLDTDANYLRCLNEALQSRNTAAVRVGIASHNLFDIAYAWLLAGERGVREDIDVEMLLGVATGHRVAVSRTVGSVLLYVPVVHADQFSAASRYLVRRLEENASTSHFLSAAADLATDPSLFERERLRFVDSIRRAKDHSLRVGARRTQNRTAPVHESVRAQSKPKDETTDLTGIVLDIARGASGGDNDPFLQTAVFSAQEQPGSVSGAPGFTNTPQTDPATAANRAWARGILARIADPASSTGGVASIHAARIEDAAQLDAAMARVKEGAASWGLRPAAERSEVLLRAGAALASRRAELIEVAAIETGIPFAEADAEVDGAVDAANYYAATCRELDGIAGARFVPVGVTVVTPPRTSPLAGAAGDVLAALAAGSGVLLKPAPQARRCGALIAEALWQAGIPRDVLVLADLDEQRLGRELIAHPAVDRVLLSGTVSTAARFRSWRHDLPLLAQTSGPNAMIITPTADLDLAVRDLVCSAFRGAGQGCSAASLAILVGSVGRSRRFARQLADATRSFRVAYPEDPRAQLGPLIAPPQGELAASLEHLEGEEKWLIAPRPLDEKRRLWSPGIRVGVQPGSRLVREGHAGPVLGIMHAPTLSAAISLQNAIDHGLAAGLHTGNPDDLALWLDEVQAGNLWVNRDMTGTVVQRQPFGGWKRSSVGPSAKAGGPNRLIALGSWRSQPRGKASSTLHLRGLDVRISGLIEAAQSALDFESFEWLRQAALADAVAWDREFGQVRDVSQLGIERNLLRYRPLPVSVRATADAGLHEILRVVLAGIRSGSDFFLSVPEGVPAGVRAELGALGVPLAVESDEEWVERIQRRAEADAQEGVPGTQTRADRVRLVGGRDAVTTLHHRLAEALQGDLDVAAYLEEVTSAGRLELLPFLHEQSISITAHRHGTPDHTFDGVI